MSDKLLSTLEDELRLAANAIGGYTDRMSRTLRLAYSAHENQFREHRDNARATVPYIVHPVGVAKAAMQFWPTVLVPDSAQDVVCACLAHDILEDTEVSASALEEVSSERVVSIVLALTKPSIARGQDRSERNKAFLSQIRAFGPTACYIKICDAIHNLSRPQTMPVHLLAKTIRKAELDYLPLVDSFASGTSLRATFESLLGEARAAWRASGHAERRGVTSDVDSAFAQAIREAHRKVLEDHDLLSIVERLTGCELAFLGGIEEFIRIELEPATGPANQRALASYAAALRKGVLELNGSETFRDLRAKIRYSRIVSAQIEPFSQTEKSKYIFLGVGADAAPWVSSATIAALVTLLSERHRLQEAKFHSQKAEEIARLGLQLSTELALRANLSFGSLLQLKELLENGASAMRNLDDFIRRVILVRGFQHKIDRVETRLKSADSIVRKVIARPGMTIEGLDDIVGIRIVTLSPSDSTNLADAILKSLTSNDHRQAPPARLEVSAIRSTTVTSDEGYRAVHIRFQVPAHKASEAVLHCELQIRTLMQDAWARLSQLLSYKQDQVAPQTRGFLKQLSTIRDNCDSSIDALGKA